MSNVVSLSGGPMPEPGKVSQALIKFLEEMLDRARAGEIVGLAGAVLHGDRCASFHIAGFTGGFSMLGALDCAHKRLVEIADA